MSDNPISGARVSEIRGTSVDSGAVDAAVPGIAGNEYRGPSRPTTSTDTTRRIQMACSPSYPNPHPCAIDGCNQPTAERRCAEHQAQLTTAWKQAYGAHLEEVRRGLVQG